MISTHQLDAVEKFCHRVGIIKNGKLVMECKPNENLEETFLSVVRE
ncbi:hypothetical protein [Archaeoglobus sp.]